MAQDGDTITYTYSDGTSVAEDISEIDTITVEYLDAAGGESNDSSVSGGSGGRVENVIADVSGFDTLYIWVSGVSVGRYYGYFSAFSVPTQPIPTGFAVGRGGGSSEISVVNTNFEDSDTEPFIAAAGGGGGAGGYNEFGDGYQGARAESTYDRVSKTGIQPPLGGEGGASSDDSTLVEDGNDGEGAVSGHNSSVSILDSGTTITGGGSGSDTNGEIKITYEGSSTTSETPSEAPSSLRVELG